MKQRICVLIILFAAAAIALPQCATRQGSQPPASAKVEAVKAVGADANGIAPSTPVGSIHRLNAGNREVLVRTKRILKMGERVYAEVGEEKVMMTATFPMLTSSKCTLEAGSRKHFGRLSKGMAVYAYVPGEKKDKISNEIRIVESQSKKNRGKWLLDPTKSSISGYPIDDDDFFKDGVAIFSNIKYGDSIGSYTFVTSRVICPRKEYQGKRENLLHKTT